MDNHLPLSIDILQSLPSIPDEDLRLRIQKEVNQKWDAIIVLDDDPTGTQTVYNIPVLTEWTEECIERELNLGTPLFFILTNSRSLPPQEAAALSKTIGQHIRKASEALAKQCFIISRSDSTLRGHYPEEVRSLEEGLEHKNNIPIIIPAFFEGGRYTIGDVHYVRQNDSLIPAAKTEFAQDKAFGYTQSDLKLWVAEKTNNQIPADKVVSFSIEALRTETIQNLALQLNSCEADMACIVNACDYYDLQKFFLALLASNIQATCRTAASFVSAIAAQAGKELLARKDMVPVPKYGGLIVVGSYVPKTTRQLTHLLQSHDLEAIELQVQQLLEAYPNNQKIVEDYSDKINQQLQMGKDVVLFTSRKLISATGKMENLSIGKTISNGLTAIISKLDVQPKYLIAKGGITSSDIATISLGVKRALVLGQALKGVPVWQLLEESKFPGLPYIIFPGNVGEDGAISELVQKLK